MEPRMRKDLPFMRLNDEVDPPGERRTASLALYRYILIGY